MIGGRDTPVYSTRVIRVPRHNRCESSGNASRIFLAELLDIAGIFPIRDIHGVSRASGILSRRTISSCRLVARVSWAL